MWLIWSVFGLFCFGNIYAVKHEGLRDQLCIDPRTGKKHEAYSEWSDAYSCSRHRCQPSGKTMSIFSVGCKKVEAPDTAIECEQVVEDTNMQFPYCCTRLRCLVVVRGEIWTKVLGQPWEALPAAPWSHMYKIKKPAPEASNEPLKTQVIHPKSSGPVYQLDSQDSVTGANKKKSLRQRVRRRRSTTYSPHAHTHEAEFDRGDDYQSYKDQSDGKEIKLKGSSETKTQSEDEEYQTMSPEFYDKLQDLKSMSDQNQGTKSVENFLFDAAERIAKEQKEAEAGHRKNMRSRMKSQEAAVENTKSDYRSNEENIQETSSDSPLDQENEKEDRKLVTDDRRLLLEEREANDDTKTVQKRKKHRSKKLRKRRIQREKSRRKKSNAEVDFHKIEKND